MKTIMDKKQITDPVELYECLISVALFNHPLEDVRPHFNEDFMGYGSAEDEVLYGWEGYKWMVERQRGELGDELLKINRIPLVENIDLNNGSAHFVEEFEFVSEVDGDEQRFILRLTTLLNLKEDKWIVSHFHGSFADVNTPEGQAWPIEEWKARNAELQAAVDVKTKELLAKNRDLEIEAALERVRGRAMAMRSSDELADLVTLVFQELTALDMELTRCLIWIFNEDHSAQWWMANSEDPTKPSVFNIPRHEHPPHQAFLSAWKENQKIWEYDLEGQVKRDWDKYLFSETELVKLPEYVQEAMQAPDKVILTATFNNFGALQSAGLESLSVENQEILKRFGQVFDQTYTRFLDLKNAEAQAREAQIMVSLERVRAASMAMHKSDQLSDVLTTLFEQFDVLKINPSHAVLTLIDPEKNTMKFRMTGKHGYRIMADQEVDLKIMDAWVDTSEKWKKSNPNAVNVNEYPPETLPAIWELYDDLIKAIPEESRMRIEDFPNGLFITEGYCKFGYIGFAHNRKPTGEEKDIVIRFASEFGSLYQRFLDLQKAEDQAREAQIEASLESIRVNLK